jgi:hypothetical protein
VVARVDKKSRDPNRPFYSDDEDEDEEAAEKKREEEEKAAEAKEAKDKEYEMDPDHALLLKQATQLLLSSNSGTRVYYYT